MSAKSRAIRFLTGVLAAVLGLACLNYGTAWSHDHHVEWAEANDMPAPSPPIFYAGAALAVLGGAVAGHALGRSKA